MRKTVLSILLVVCASVGMRAEAEQARAASVPRPRVVLVTVDGLAGDMADDLAFFKSAKKEGAWTFKARAPHPAITVVSHAAMFTGREPADNGVKSFEPDKKKLAKWRPLKVSTVFAAARAAKLKTAGYHQKRKLDSLMPVEEIDQVERFTDSSTLVDWFCASLEAGENPDLIFLHLADVDAAGHTHGWRSEEQKEAAARVNARLEEIVECLAEDEGSTGRRTLLIVTSDHGGHKKTHGKNLDSDRLVPWVAIGPDVAAGSELSDVRLEDTGAVIVETLGLTLPDLDGTVPDGFHAP